MGCGRWAEGLGWRWEPFRDRVNGGENIGSVYAPSGKKRQLTEEGRGIYQASLVFWTTLRSFRRYRLLKR